MYYFALSRCGAEAIVVPRFPRRRGPMRGLKTISAIAFTSAVFTSAAYAAPACGPLAMLTSLDLVTVSGGRPGVTATIVDKPATLLVDTGAPFSTLNRQVARELNLPVGPA